MCGIIGYKSFNNTDYTSNLKKGVSALQSRGPDNQSTYMENTIGLGHARLSILDTSSAGNQPMHDASGRYHLVFNGEIYNYKQLQNEIGSVALQSSSDTEVLLHLLIQQGADCLKKLNGFFAFAFYDSVEDYLLLARDRFGIKPLHVYQDKEKIVFGSELKAIHQFPIKKEINHHALFWYLKLNYLPGSLSMLKGMTKLIPGNYLEIKNDTVIVKTYFSLPSNATCDLPFKDAKNRLVDLLDASVQKRLIADVPLGSFLSGGTDSSAIVALASRHHDQLNTFSIGYKDHSFFDETHYAELVAKKFNTNHTVFSLSNDDLLSEIDHIIQYIDEPFGDSSAIPTYILAKRVREKVTVALSGDGADELFGGYYKHMALNKSLTTSLTNTVIQLLSPISSALPQSRSGKLANGIRRVNRFGNMLSKDAFERYWFLASLTDNPQYLIKKKVEDNDIQAFKANYLNKSPAMNDYLDTDMQIVLAGDMLVKVDLMSMANSLEVRVPFLDKDVVSFARNLPIDYKLQGNERKKIVQDAFREILPPELYQRPKKGFEVPLLHWMQNELLSDLDGTLFNKEYLITQNLFEPEPILSLRKRLLSNNPGDVHGIVWALFIFQKWYLKYFEI